MNTMGQPAQMYLCRTFFRDPSMRKKIRAFEVHVCIGATVRGNLSPASSPSRHTNGRCHCRYLHWRHYCSSLAEAPSMSFAHITHTQSLAAWPYQITKLQSQLFQQVTWQVRQVACGVWGYICHRLGCRRSTGRYQ